MRKFNFENDQIYHVYNRGTDKRTIYEDKKDYQKFLDDLDDFRVYEIPDKKLVLAKIRDEEEERSKGFDSLAFGEDVKNETGDKHIVLVDVLAFCLMPNHFHLLLRQKSDGGIVKFMQRLGIAYTKYFNEKGERSGVLFQGVFKAIHVNKQEYLDYIIFYIHLNPLSLVGVNKAMDKNFALPFLEEYEWSSHSAYCLVDKLENSLVDKTFILENFENSKNYKKKTLELFKIINKINMDKLFNSKFEEFEK